MAASNNRRPLNKPRSAVIPSKVESAEEKVLPVEETKEETLVTNKVFPNNLENKSTNSPQGEETVVFRDGEGLTFKAEKLDNGWYKIPTIYREFYPTNSKRPTRKLVHSGKVPVNKGQLDRLKKLGK